MSLEVVKGNGIAVLSVYSLVSAPQPALTYSNSSSGYAPTYYHSIRKPAMAVT